ncbi:MAG TPA: hypothetical protein VF679_08940, partial [Pedobacter sp.]
MSVLSNNVSAKISALKEPPVTALNYQDSGHCLFQFIDAGYCNSSYLSSPSFLDLGGALAAFGLIFTVYQLRNPQWDLVLRIRASWQRNLFWILGSIALVLIFARVVITQIPLAHLRYPFSVPLLYELFAYVFFVASPISLLLFARKARGLFTEKTAEKFYAAMLSGVSKSDDKWSDAALEVLLHNLDDIFETINKTDRKSDINQYARSVVDVMLSEESVVKIITTRRLDALQHVLYMLEKHNINRQQCNVAVPAILRNLFLDESSFFYKHLSRDGLSLSSNIYRSIFASPKLLSNFNLFGYPTLGFSARSNSRIALKVFVEALTKAMSTHFKTGRVSVSYLNDGLEYLSNAFGGICSKIAADERKGMDTRSTREEEWATLQDIAHFLSHDYPFLDYEEELNQDVLNAEKTPTVASFRSGTAVNAGIAAVLYKAFEQLAQFERKTDIYHLVLQLLQGLDGDEYKYKKGYRPAFEKRIWEQIARNVLERYYPAVLPVYLNYIGFTLVSDTPRTGWTGEQTERMRRLLYVDLKPLLEKGEKMANETKMEEALLPEAMKYQDGK